MRWEHTFYGGSGHIFKSRYTRKSLTGRGSWRIPEHVVTPFIRYKEKMVSVPICFSFWVFNVLIFFIFKCGNILHGMIRYLFFVCIRWWGNDNIRWAVEFWTRNDKFVIDAHDKCELNRIGKLIVTKKDRQGSVFDNVVEASLTKDESPEGSIKRINWVVIVIDSGLSKDD